MNNIPASPPCVKSGQVIPFDRTKDPADNPGSRADYEAWMAECGADPEITAWLDGLASPFKEVK